MLKEIKYINIINTYKNFFQSFEKGPSEYFEKTIKNFINEIYLICFIYKITPEEFLKKVFSKKEEIKDFINENQFNKIKKIYGKKNKTFFSKDILMNEIIKTEIYSKKTDKIQTELILKILLFVGDWDSISMLLQSKIFFLIKNSKINLVDSREIDDEDMLSQFMFEIIKGLTTYRKRLKEGKGHSTKILSYIDRIVRNITYTLISKFKNPNAYFCDISTESENGETKGIENILEEDLNENLKNGIKEKKEIVDNGFDSWDNLIKYIPNSSKTIFNHSYIYNLHYFEQKELGIKSILNFQGFYFFEKVVKNYQLYGKLISSFFDLILFLKKEGKTKIEIYKILFLNNNLKFGILGLEGEVFGKTFIYQSLETQYLEFFKDEIEFTNFKKLIKYFLSFIFYDKKIKNSKTIFINFFKVFRKIEKIFNFDKFFCNIFEEKNKLIFCFIMEKYYKKQEEQLFFLLNLKKKILKNLKKYKKNNKIINLSLKIKQNKFKNKLIKNSKFKLNFLNINKKEINILLKEIKKQKQYFNSIKSEKEIDLSKITSLNLGN